jgi:hypothetical protein
MFELLSEQLSELLVSLANCAKDRSMRDTIDRSLFLARLRHFILLILLQDCPTFFIVWYISVIQAIYRIFSGADSCSGERNEKRCIYVYID